MNIRTNCSSGHPASRERQIGTLLGLATCILLVSGCAAQTSPGYSHHNQAISLARCREGTVEFCQVRGVDTPETNSPNLRCDCVTPVIHRPAQGFAMRHKRSH